MNHLQLPKHTWQKFNPIELQWAYNERCYHSVLLQAIAGHPDAWPCCHATPHQHSLLLATAGPGPTAVWARGHVVLCVQLTGGCGAGGTQPGAGGVCSTGRYDETLWNPVAFQGVLSPSACGTGQIKHNNSCQAHLLASVESDGSTQGNLLTDILPCC